MKLRTIFWFWLPLAFSFLLMTVEGPWIQGVITRKADPELQLAAFGIVISLSVLIEAPVIMFLAVGSALASSRQSYNVLWWYTMVVNALVTIVAALMAFTPLLDLYLGSLLGIPDPIIAAARPGMAIMILWSGFIGYRRFHQGVLIKHGRTRSISMGTVVRISISASIAIGLGLWSQLPGAVIGACALIFAVFGEMIYIHVVSRPEVRKLDDMPHTANRPALTYRRVLRFHLPLALTSITTLFTMPVIQHGLASTNNAEQALAAFPVIYSILLVMRSGGFSWQEGVIALSKGPQEVQAIRRFTLLLGFGTSGITLLFAATPLINLYTGTILDVPEALMPMIVTGVLVGTLIPLCVAFQSYFRGMLMRANTTEPIYQGMILGFISLALMMWAGIQLGLPGITVASTAMSGGVAVELLYLWLAFNRKGQQLEHAWQIASAAEAG